MRKKAFAGIVIVAVLVVMIQLMPVLAFGQTTIEVEMGLLKAGDSNGDHTVNGLDFTEMVNSFLKSVGEPGFDPDTDFNNDGTINGLDFSEMVVNFLEESPQEVP